MTKKLDPVEKTRPATFSVSLQISFEQSSIELKTNPKPHCGYN